MQILPEIPKLYTAIAEWLCCLIYVLLLKRRLSVKKTIFCSSAFLILEIIMQFLIGRSTSNLLWIIGMATALVIMYIMIYSCCDVNKTDALFYWSDAFICAEFMASIEWQFYCIFDPQPENYGTQSIIIMSLIFGLVFGIYYRLKKRRMVDTPHLKVNYKQALAVSLIAIGSFCISNISYVSVNTPLSSTVSLEIFYIRTLVDFAGVIMIYTQLVQLQEMQKDRNLQAIDSMLKLQYEQYRLSKENIETLNRKYHDLKHQIAIIRQEPDLEKKENYLEELEQGVRQYESVSRTGDAVLDTILTSKQLYCSQHGITMTVMADGSALDLMEIMDICSIFGNMLDNAIESVMKLSDKRKRLIRLRVEKVNNFLMIKEENYFETPIMECNGEIATSKTNDKGYHGYGIKSIKYTAEKYHGSTSVESQDNWFYITILIPLK